MSISVSIAGAKAKLSALIDQALAGEEVVLARAGKAIARIVPMPRREPRRPGLLRHWGGDPLASLEGISDRMRDDCDHASSDSASEFDRSGH